VKEWFEVKTADEAAIKAGHPIAHAGFSVGSMFNSITAPYDSKQQVFNRVANPDLYVPEPAMFDNLDLDDNVILRKYRDQPRFFTQKLAELHVDINTVLVKTNLAPIRFLSIEEQTPVHLWHLFLLTGNYTATLFEDGIHLQRHGFPDQILGGHVRSDDRRLHGEMGTILWRRDAQGRWRVDANTSSWIWQISITSIDEIRKHEDLGPAFRVDCAALRKFVQPLPPGESAREMTLKVDVPVIPSERKKFPRGQVCQVDIARGFPPECCSTSPECPPRPLAIWCGHSPECPKDTFVTKGRFRSPRLVADPPPPDSSAAASPPDFVSFTFVLCPLRFPRQLQTGLWHRWRSPSS
jgi:hypothetical protein